ncbi:MAG: TIR domain-containing protein [Chloroflexi bacterium]|nr:TIR domain-containing protein [Chloroflexota bacterium]
MDQKTVFISYRRSASKHLARSIYQDLKMNGWDAFLDVNTIDSGDFDRIILNQIGARAHFVLLVSAGAMERCTNPDDWLRREIAEAVRLGRNIVPILDEGADLERELRYLPDDLREIIRRKNGPPFSHYYFEATMEALRTRFLKTDADIEITAVPSEDEDEVRRRLDDVDRETRETSIMVLPAPFLWVPVPGDSGKAWTGEPFAIAKYPVTNAQYQLFVEAGGYNRMTGGRTPDGRRAPPKSGAVRASGMNRSGRCPISRWWA